MNLRDYYRSLSGDAREEYAARAGTTVAYIRHHLILVKRPPRKIPRPRLLRGLAEASDGAVSYDEVLHHFLPNRSTEAA